MKLVLLERCSHGDSHQGCPSASCWAFMVPGQFQVKAPLQQVPDSWAAPPAVQENELLVVGKMAPSSLFLHPEGWKLLP